MTAALLGAKLRNIAGLIFVGCAVSCTNHHAHYLPSPDLPENIEKLTERYKAAILGIWGIRNEEPVWTGYYDNESPGVPARPDTRNGAVIFVNSAQGVLLWPKLVDVIDPDEEFQNVFHDVIAKFFPNEN